MADIVDQATRGRMMSGIRSRNTKPERTIRSGLHRLGFRFALHKRKLAGTPDLVLPKYNAVVFVHGCFWHGHDCSLFRIPGTRTEFWKNKFSRNSANDAAATSTLLNDGLRVAVVWECAIRGQAPRRTEEVIGRIARWLRSNRRFLELRGMQQKRAA